MLIILSPRVLVWFFSFSVIFWYRAVSVVITSSPYPDASCVSTATGSVWSEGVKITFGVTHTCGDCMFSSDDITHCSRCRVLQHRRESHSHELAPQHFLSLSLFLPVSGHTAAITLLMMIWSHYSRGEEFAVCFGTCQGILTSNVDAAGDPMGWKFLDFLLYAWMLMCMYFIIATRSADKSEARYQRARYRLDVWRWSKPCLNRCFRACAFSLVACRFHYSHDVFVGFVITYLLFHAYHFYVKSLAMRQGSLFARFMRWFEGVNLDADTLERATLDCDTGTGHAILGSSAATAEAIRAGMEMTKNNRMFCVKRTAVAALPVSYLEGNNYYRVGGDNTKLTHLHPDAAANAAAAARCNHSNGHTAAPAATTEMATMPPPLVKPEGGTDNDASVVGARFSHSPPGTQIDGFEHDTTVRIHTHHDAAATAAAAAAAAGSPGHGLPVEHAHNEQLPIPILVTGEAAAQEEREVRTSPDMV